MVRPLHSVVVGSDGGGSHPVDVVTRPGSAASPESEPDGESQVELARARVETGYPARCHQGQPGQVVAPTHLLGSCFVLGNRAAGEYQPGHFTLGVEFDLN